MPFRIGTGFDIHRLVEGRKLILAGIEIPSQTGLLGHSDADVIVHAVADAMLGALALGDIGAWYPDTSPATKDMYSLNMLPHILATMRENGYDLINIDINCICEKPKLSPYREAMCEKLAAALDTSAGNVSVKFRTHEGLGEIGKGEAIAAQAVVLLEKTKRS